MVQFHTLLGMWLIIHAVVKGRKHINAYPSGLLAGDLGNHYGDVIMSAMAYLIPGI